MLNSVSELFASFHLYARFLGDLETWTFTSETSLQPISYFNLYLNLIKDSDSFQDKVRLQKLSKNSLTSKRTAAKDDSTNHGHAQ